MMFMATPTTIVDQINRIFKDFLWGFDTETSKQKTPLVSWKQLTQPRENGGLGFKDYITHSKSLLSRWVARILEDDQSEWKISFMGLIKDFSWEQRHAQNWLGYTDLDKIMHDTMRSFGATLYAAGLWKAWLSLCRHLFLELEGNSIPAHQHISSNVITALQPYAALNVEQARDLNKTLGKLGVLQVTHLWDERRKSQKTF